MTALKVPGHRVLVKPKDVKETTTTEWGFEIAVNDDLEREYRVNTTEGEVVAIGPTAWMAYDYWKPDGTRNPLWEPWCQVGDIIKFAKYGVSWTEIDGVPYVLLNDQDVLMPIEKEASNG